MPFESKLWAVRKPKDPKGPTKAQRINMRRHETLNRKIMRTLQVDVIPPVANSVISLLHLPAEVLLRVHEFASAGNEELRIYHRYDRSARRYQQMFRSVSHSSLALAATRQRLRSITVGAGLVFAAYSQATHYFNLLQDTDQIPIRLMYERIQQYALPCQQKKYLMKMKVLLCTCGINVSCLQEVADVLTIDEHLNTNEIPVELDIHVESGCHRLIKSKSLWECHFLPLSNYTQSLYARASHSFVPHIDYIIQPLNELYRKRACICHKMYRDTIETQPKCIICQTATGFQERLGALTLTRIASSSTGESGLTLHYEDIGSAKGPLHPRDRFPVYELEEGPSKKGDDMQYVRLTIVGQDGSW